MQLRTWSVLGVLVACHGLVGADAPAAPKVPKQLLEKRLEAARKVYEQNLTQIKGGQGHPAEVLEWSERRLDAELALAAGPADRAKALQANLERLREVERIASNFARAGQGRQADADAATFFRLQAEIRLAAEGLEIPPAAGIKESPGKH